MTDLQLAVLLRQIAGRLGLMITESYSVLPADMEHKGKVTQEFTAFYDELLEMANNLERPTA